MPFAPVARKQRILLLNSTLFIGGAENVLAELCRGLDRERFDVTVAHLKGRGQIGDALAREGYDVVSLQGTRTDRTDYLSSIRLRRFLLAREIDLVHTNDLHAMVDAAICRVTLPRLRLINTFHYGNYPRPNRRYHLAEKYLCRISDRLVAVGEAQKASILRSYSLRRERVQVLRNGVTDMRAGALDDYREKVRAGRPLVIGSVSTLIEQKGIAYLLDVAAILKQQGLDFRLVVAGEGTLRPMLQQKAAELGLNDHVEFFGWVEDAPRRVLPWIDIFVQTSLWEAMSMVVLEAMSCGLPVVATTVGENPHVIQNGVNGFLAAPKAVDDLAAALARLIQSEELRHQVGARARLDWETNYTAERMCRQYEELYRQTLRSRQAK